MDLIPNLSISVFLQDEDLSWKARSQILPVVEVCDSGAQIPSGIVNKPCLFDTITLLKTETQIRGTGDGL
jgi:hypothetical protein